MDVGLLILREARVERAASLMSRVGAGHGKSTRKSWIAGGRRRAKRRLNRSVQTAAPLKQESPVPVFRKGERESDSAAQQGEADAGPAKRGVLQGHRSRIGWNDFDVEDRAADRLSPQQPSANEVVVRHDENESAQADESLPPRRRRK